MIRSVILVILIFSFGCSRNYKFYRANRAYMQSDYITAIQKYDEFIDRKKNSAMQTQAELERSDCYYQLGYNEFQQENWEIASQYLYLANSIIADDLLDVCYKKLAALALENGDTLRALDYYSYIIDYLPNSTVYDAVIVERIKLNDKQQNYADAFQDYRLLWERSPDSEQRKNVQPIIDRFVPNLLQKAYDYKAEGNYLLAVNELLKFTKYPLTQHKQIINEICDLYLILAELRIEDKDYKSARSYFDRTLQTCPEKSEIVQNRISSTCSEIIKEADLLQQELKFDQAIARYNLCYILQEDHTEAAAKIAAAEENKAKYLKALEFENTGQSHEDKNDFADALQSYRQSASYYDSERIRNKIFRTQNLIEAEKDPKAFALKIINDHDNGNIVKNLETLKQNMRARYGEYVQFSDWKVTYAIGNYKYEVRYDVISTEETFYFAWRVDLLTQKVNPSNRVSENLMITGDLMQHQNQE